MSHGNASLAVGFARAVIELALEPWLAGMNAVHKKLIANPNLGPRLDDRALPFAERQKQLDEILPDGTSETIRNFFYTLLKEGNVHVLEDIRNSVLALMTQAAKIEETIVTTAVPLSDDETAQFEQKLTAKYGDNLDIRFNVDPQIIGGVVVWVGDKILDGSLAAKINAAETSLKSLS